MLAAEQHKRQEMEIELGAQRQVNEDIMQQLHDQISLNHHLRCQVIRSASAAAVALLCNAERVLISFSYAPERKQLSEERRQHELTNLKLETAANAAADIYDGRPDSFENMQVEELSQLCRQLDLCWKVWCACSFLVVAVTWPPDKTKFNNKCFVLLPCFRNLVLMGLFCWLCIWISFYRRNKKETGRC
jgi:hypothetical protein